jgi:hypothetical protein
MLSPLLFALVSANLVWAMSMPYIWTKVVVAAMWGWSLIRTIQGCLIEQDIKNTEREIERLTHWRSVGNHEGRMDQIIKEARRAGQRQSVPVQDLWKTGPMH